MKILLLTSSSITYRNSLIEESYKKYLRTFKDTSHRFSFLCVREGGSLDKEDLIQELFIKLIDNIDKSINEEKDLEKFDDSSFIYWSSSNWMKNYAKTLFRQKRGYDPEEEAYVRVYIEDINPEVLSYDGKDIELLFEEVERYLSKLDNKYLSLSETEFEVMKLYYFNDKTQTEIANSLGVRQQRVSEMLKKVREVAIPIIKEDIELLVAMHGG